MTERPSSRDAVIAFDPGTKHLGVCTMAGDAEVLLWEVMDVSGGVAEFTETMGALDDLIRRAHTAVIERQPPLNRSAVLIQHWLELYVHSVNQRCTIVLLNAQSRVAYLRRHRPELNVSSYAQRKKSSCVFVHSLLRAADLARFESARKKDDLAEAYILAVMFNN